MRKFLTAAKVSDGWVINIIETRFAKNRREINKIIKDLGFVERKDLSSKTMIKAEV